MPCQPAHSIYQPLAKAKPAAERQEMHHPAVTSLAMALYMPHSCSAQLIRGITHVENRALAVLPHALVLEHARVDARVLALDLQPRARRHGVNDIVVVAVRAVLVALVELAPVLAKALFALFARKYLKAPRSSAMLGEHSTVETPWK